ncbi:MAG: sulfatase-like hydrolase/transferase, partial [Phycisphaeraceae bacterium]
RDCFGTQVVALRHQGGLRKEIRTLPEMLRDAGYTSRCVGFTGNPSSRGFDQYLDYEQWGDWEHRPARKAEQLNDVALPELDRLAAGDQPWFMMLRHMDPHSPYLPPSPYNKLFHSSDPADPALPDTAKPMFEFQPFADYFRTWMPPNLRDIDWIDAQYDGAVAYMDACIGVIFKRLEELGILEDTIVVLNGDHGEILQEHECWFDHHGMYDPNLHVPLIIRYPAGLPEGVRVDGFNQHKDLVPTLLELANVKLDDALDGRPLTALVNGEAASFDSEFYITECTWMRKHGWRTPQWKFIEALEPDFHHMPPVELYNLADDPLERHNVAEREPDMVATLRERMRRFIASREQATGLGNPIENPGNWSGKSDKPFASSDEAYRTLHIGDASAAKRIQAGAAASKTGDSKQAASKPSPVDGDADLAELLGPAEKVVTVIGRGHSGTRAVSHTLSASGVFMGEPLNHAGDLLPPERMYEACRIIGRHVRYLGENRWDLSKLHTMPIDPAFTRLIREYLVSVIDADAAWRGWKIPETTLCYPWLVRLLPDIHYIHWWRDPRDCILGGHKTDDLREFGIECPPVDDPFEQRAMSWLYQDQLMRETPAPRRIVRVRFEDFVLKQPSTLKTLSGHLGLELKTIPVKPEAVGRWKTHEAHREIAILQPTLERLGYLEPTQR